MAADPKQPLATASGEPVELFSTTLRGLFPWGGIRKTSTGETVDQWKEGGFKIDGRTPDPLDLVNPAPTRGYVNVYTAELYATQVAADTAAAAKPGRIARLIVKFVNGQLD